MFKLIQLVLTPLLTLLVINPAIAHSGRTDENGCHHDRQNGDNKHCHPRADSSSSPSSPNYSSPSYSSPSYSSPNYSSPTGRSNIIPNIEIHFENSNLEQHTNFFLGFVTSVIDGNNVLVQLDNSNQLITVNLACINAPSLDDIYRGALTKNHLESLLPINSKVLINILSQDNDLIIGEIFSQNSSINYQMIFDGKALVSQNSPSYCLDNYEVYLQAQQQAQQYRLGFWNPAFLAF